MADETAAIPKPMVEIGGRPILWHIMRLYAHFGLTGFIVCLGHKGYVIKEYFASYMLHRSDVTIDLGANRIDCHNRTGEEWRVTLVSTGDATETGGRIRRDSGRAMRTLGWRAETDIGQAVACTAARHAGGVARCGHAANGPGADRGVDDGMTGPVACHFCGAKLTCEACDFGDQPLANRFVPMDASDLPVLFADYSCLSSVSAFRLDPAARGSFARLSCVAAPAAHDIAFSAAQISISRSPTRGTLRGLLAPLGRAHGMLTLTDDTMVTYQIDRDAAWPDFAS